MSALNHLEKIVLSHSGKNRDAARTAIMGIINLSQDSFYGKSRAATVQDAVKQAELFVEEGAAMLDIGAESTRPGSRPVSEDLEAQRLIPVVAQIRKRFASVPLSVDTYKPSVAEQVLSEGATIINDVTGLQKHSAMAGIIGRFKAGVILMHMQGTPRTMQENPKYEDLIRDIIAYLEKSVRIAENAGIAPDRIWVDPGIGFGKLPAHNLEIIRRLGDLAVLKRPILVGVSRKSFIGKVLDLAVDERLEGSLAAAVVAVMNGAAVIRTHDVAATYRAVKMAQAILRIEEGVS